MERPYRKLFNLFAFSLLAFAIYLNFFRVEDSLPASKNTSPYGQVTASAQPKPLVSADNSKSPITKTEEATKQ